MFERTALPSGPRVISSRLPGARSVSIAAYVLAGSRLESAAEAGVAHFMEHITFKGTQAYPSTRAISEAIEGVGGSFNAVDRPRIDRLLGARPAARGHARDGRPRRAHRAGPILDGKEIDGERNVIIEEIRSYQDDPAEYAQMLFQTALFGDGPLGREICGDEPGIRALPEATIRDFWRTTYRPANTVVAVAGDLDHARGRRPRRGGVRHRQRRRSRASIPRPPCRPASGRDSASARRRRRSSSSGSRPCGATIPTAGSSRCSTRSSATG